MFENSYIKNLSEFHVCVCVRVCVCVCVQFQIENAHRRLSITFKEENTDIYYDKTWEYLCYLEGFPGGASGKEPIC